MTGALWIIATGGVAAAAVGLHFDLKSHTQSLSFGLNVVNDTDDDGT